MPDTSSPAVTTALDTRARSTPERNRLRPEDRAVHDWYRFVLSFPSHLVRDYLNTFSVDSTQRVLDPFCGTGTTLVECKKLGIPSVGIERNPMAGFATHTKLNWSVDPDLLADHARAVGAQVLAQLEGQGIDDLGIAPLFQTNGQPVDELRTLPSERLNLLLKNSISPLPLHKTLLLLDVLQQQRDDTVYPHEQLALAAALVSDIGNLHFGPEVGVGRIQADAPVIGPWLDRVRAMANDLATLRDRAERKRPSMLRTRVAWTSVWSHRPSTQSSRRRRIRTRRTTRERHGSKACYLGSFGTSGISAA